MTRSKTAALALVLLLAGPPARADVGVEAAGAEAAEAGSWDEPEEKEPEAPIYGWLVVQAEPVGADIAVDGEGEGPAPRRIQVAPGEHELVVSMGGYLSTTRSVSVEAARETTITVLLEPDPAYMFTTEGHVAFWGGLGLGAVLASVGHLGAAETADRFRTGQFDRQERNHTYSVMAVSGWVVAAVGMAVGVAMWTSPPRYRSEADMICSTYKITGTRTPRKVCRPRKRQ
jgi:hypothetical protein